jgi:FtsH-binding integral membrane protein
MSAPLVNAEDISLAAAPERRTSTLRQLKKFVGRYFYFSMSLLFAAVVVWGFSRTVNDSLFRAVPPRPLLLWIHGTVFSGWVAFFIAQSMLVRLHKVSWHRFFGWLGVGLAAVMVPLGVAIAIVMARFDTVQLHVNDADAFLAIPFYGMIAFGVIVALAIYWKRRPEFHRRLMFVGTCGLMDAALARFDFMYDHKLFFLGVDLLIALGVIRDLFVDGRVHKVYLYTLPAIIIGQNLALYLWRIDPPWWRTVTHAILG